MRGTVKSYKTKHGKRWEVFYTCQKERVHKRGFESRDDAQSFLDEKTVEMSTGTYITKDKLRITVEEEYRELREGHSGGIHADSTLRREDAVWRNHVKPRWGHRKINAIRYSEVQAWVAELSKSQSPSSVEKAFTILNEIMNLAIKDHILPRGANPCSDIDLPKRRKAEAKAFTFDEVIRIAECAGEIDVKYRALILVLGFCGLRWGEAIALTVDDVDLDHNQIHVTKSATQSGRTWDEKGTKTNRNRIVPMPEIVKSALASLIDGRLPGSRVFSGDGNYPYPVQQSIADRHDGWYKKSLIAAGAPLYPPKALRSTFATLALQASGDLKAVQKAMGHASAKMTTDVYATATPESFNRLRDSMDDGIDEANARAALTQRVDSTPPERANGLNG